MKHVIIGMAGHVDHGKTELVKALTGVDTDRLAEEKKRGITIDLGFARLDFPDGSCASIVDVPGHERFIKNMLAGAGGVDLAMLVVAADEGFMPQTVEHLDILQLLGVKDGLIVLTKTDLVDEDWLNMLEEDVKSRVKGTFLEDKPILRTSVRTGEGIEALREALHDLTLHAEEKSARTPNRLLTAATPTGRPKYQLICAFAARQSVSRSACPSTACFRWTASAPSSPARSSTGTSPSATRRSSCRSGISAACAICRCTGATCRRCTPDSARRST